MQCLIRLLQATLKPQVMILGCERVFGAPTHLSFNLLHGRKDGTRIKELLVLCAFFSIHSLSTVDRLTLVKNIVDIDSMWNLVYCKSTSRPCPFFFATPNPAESAPQVMPIYQVPRRPISHSLHSVSSMAMVLSLMYLLSRCRNLAILEYCGAVN